MANSNKDIIYIDVDDEITSVIDKVRGSDGKILALVLPKRASVFQSIVNMKLLKRSADEEKKRLVLITSEAGLLPLAGAVGLHVAKTLQSKPEVPASPETVDSEETVQEDSGAPVDVETAGAKPIGELAGPAAAVPLAADDAMETVELDNEDTETAPLATPASSAPLPLAAKKNKKLKVPDFNRFRLWLALGVLGLAAIIVFLYFAVAVLPRATIAIKTNATNVNTNVTLALDTKADSLDTTSKTVPAKLVQEQKTYSQEVAATGQKNNGQKATGQVKIINCTAGEPVTVPAGTGVSSGGLTYITQQDASMPVGSTSCTDIAGATSDTVDVVAQSPGTKYNLAAGTSFTVAGFASSTQASASSALAGGTDDIVKVVAQADIDKATKQITTQDDTVKQDLTDQLTGLQLFALKDTFAAGDPATTTSSKVGDAADTVTVTQNITYTMLGAKESDLKALIDDNIKSQIDTAKQSILSEGLDKADVKVLAATKTTTQITLQTVALVGPDIDTNSIKQAAAGKKSAEIQSLVQNDPGVTDVSVHMSPFWVTRAPKNTDKITVTIAKPTTTVNANATP